MLHDIRNRHSRAPGHAHAAVHQHSTTSKTRFLDPGADRVELRLECVDAIVADALDVEDFDSAFAFFDPEGALISRTLPRGVCGGSGICGVSLCGSGWRGRGRRLRWGYERTFADGDDMCDSQGVKHIYIRSVIPV